MSRIFSYVGILIITFIFTYIFNVRENNILLLILVIMPIFDGVSFLYFKWSISAKLDINSDTTEKGQKVFCTIKINNKGILPVPCIDYKLNFNGKVKVSEDIYERISLGIRQSYNKSEALLAAHIGLAEINLDDVVLSSLFGLFKCKVKCEEANKKFTIVPRIPNVDGMDMLTESSEISDDEDSSNLCQGEPGYEYKDYSAGDPLSRVNWKLSSKKNKLVIRKSLARVKCKKIIVLDNYIVQNEDIEDISDLLSEAIIGVANELFLMDYEVKVYINNSNKWNDRIINSLKCVEELQIDFSKYTFGKVSGRFEGLSIYNEEKYDVILITSNKDEGILNFIKSIEENCNSVEIISNNRTKLMSEEFYIKTDYELERL